MPSPLGLFNPVLPPFLELGAHTIYLRPDRQRGKDSEALVEKALCRMLEKAYGLDHPIKDFIHAEPNSELDREQVDFLIEVDPGLQIKLQVKSSEGQKRKCEKTMERLGRLVVAVAVKSYECVERVVHKVVEALKLALSKLRRKANNKIMAERMRMKPHWEERCSRFQPTRMCH